MFGFNYNSRFLTSISDPWNLLFDGIQLKRVDFVNAVVLSRRLIALLPVHSSHVKAVTRLHVRCFARPPGWFCNVVCVPLQISK